MVTHRQIEAFRAVMLARNFTAAGQMLSVTQGAVSKIIAELEVTVGFALFSRRKGGIEPTAEALALQREVESSFQGLERIQRSAERIRQGQEGELRIAAVPALATGFAQEVLKTFLRDGRRLSVTLDTYNSDEVVDLVAGGYCDLGFTMTPVPDASVHVDSVMSVQCVAVLPKAHPLLAKRELCLEDFTDQAFISLADNTTTRLKIDAAFRAANVQRRLEVEARWSASVCGFVAQGFGLSIIEPFSATALRRIGFEVRPLSEPLDFSFASIMPKHKRVGSLVRGFNQLILERASQFVRH